MSISKKARLQRIDDAAKRIERSASALHQQLETMTRDTLAFAAFMHTDPDSDGFDQVDRDKYSAMFATQLGNLNATMQKLAPLAGIESGDVTVQQFLDAYTGTDPSVYSKQFD